MAVVILVLEQVGDGSQFHGGYLELSNLLSQYFQLGLLAA
jgi:hypothetical protein